MKKPLRVEAVVNDKEYAVDVDRDAEPGWLYFDEAGDRMVFSHKPAEEHPEWIQLNRLCPRVLRSSQPMTRFPGPSQARRGGLH